MVSGQWSSVKGHWSMVNKWPIICGQLSGLNFHLGMVIGHWSPVTGHWSLVICHWSLVTGHLSMATGHWLNCQFSKYNDQLSFVSGHWSMVICQMLMDTGQWSLVHGNRFLVNKLPSDSGQWLKNDPQFLLHFLMHFDEFILCRKFQVIMTSIC